MKISLLILFLSCSLLEAQNVISNEPFADCSLPGKWEINSTQGNYGFSITKSNLFPKSDATCSIIYQQSNNSNTGSKEFKITTKEFKLFSYDEYSFTFGLRFTRPNQIGVLKLNMIVDGVVKTLQTYSADISHPTQIIQEQSIKLSGLKKAKTIKFSFEYQANGNDFNNLIIIDNIILAGPDNDDCSRAIELVVDNPCLSGNSTGASITGPPVKCSGQYIQGLWYTFTPNYSGQLKINNFSSYNDAVSVFKGSCNGLQDVQCINRDEYGFEGEQEFIEVNAGEQYFLRISKQTNYYGREDIDDFCIAIEKINPKYPAHDQCAQSIGLTIGNLCVQNNNYTAHFDHPVPSLNERSRADVWYHFTPTQSNPLEISSQANFADVLTLYKGDCNNLVEVKCEDFGSKLILSNPIPNTLYRVQVSGYFSSIEGNLCVEVKERSATKPSNDDCLTAKAIELNKLCVNSDNINANVSKLKGSCVVYHAPDIWYSFIAPLEKEVAIDIEAGFNYSYTVYSGQCSNLTEFSCGSSPDPCGDYLYLKGLNPGKTYYLQIISNYKPIKTTESQICVRINEVSKTVPKTPLNLQLTTECLHGVLGKVNYVASGGKGLYKYFGPDPSDYFLPGEKIEAFVEDERGCRDFAQTIIGCTPPKHCSNSTLDISIDFECLQDSIGRQTGEVVLHISGKGGSGAYYYYGTKDGAKLRHGDPYAVVLIDSDSCYLIEEGQIICPPFDCSQSNLTITADYECIDTLLRARLHLDIKGNLGNYQLSGNTDGELMKNGDPYTVMVIDQAACSAEISGLINCNFDSCAFARPELKVDYDCILDSLGNRTGQAILHIDATSYAGGIMISGHQSGDTLNHLETYSVLMVDSFGCELKNTGVISCVPVNVKTDTDASFVSAYPNPTENNVKIEFHNISDPIIELFIYTNQGRNIYQRPLLYEEYKNSTYLHMATFPAGVYYVKLKGKTFFDIIRLIKI